MVHFRWLKSSSYNRQNSLLKPSNYLIFSWELLFKLLEYLKSLVPLISLIQLSISTLKKLNGAPISIVCKEKIKIGNKDDRHHNEKVPILFKIAQIYVDLDKPDLAIGYLELIDAIEPHFGPGNELFEPLVSWLFLGLAILLPSRKCLRPLHDVARWKYWNFEWEGIW